MKIYTKTGDKGQTSLLGGKRLYKNNIRIEAYGNIDELNAFLGLLNDHCEHEKTKTVILTIQDRLFTMGSILAAAGEENRFKLPTFSEQDITLLESEIDQMNEELPPMQSFILPGGNKAASYAHVCRTVCRRAERKCVELSQNEDVPTILIQYLNRLSDYLFVLSRFITKISGSTEVLWQPKL